jgi:integrase
MTNTGRQKLSDRIVASLPPHDPDSASTQREYPDCDAVGLRITVGKSGRRFWDFRYMFNRRKRILRLGEFPAVNTAEARKRAWEARAAITRGADPSRAIEERRRMPTLAEFCNEYIPHARRTIRSWKETEGRLRNHILPTLGKRLLSDIRRVDVERLYGDLLDVQSVASANRAICSLKAVMTHAVRCEVIDRSPADRIRLKKENNARTRSLSRDELRRYLAALEEEPNPHLRGLLLVLLASGLRRSEWMMALWKQVDFNNHTLHLPHTKSGRSRTVPLNQVALFTLEQLPRVEGNPYIFPGSRPGKPITEPKFAHRRACEKAGIKDFKIHDLRHTFASLVVSSGQSLYTVQTLLGHSSPIMSQRYSHLSTDALREGSKVVSDIIQAPTEEKSETPLDEEIG